YQKSVLALAVRWVLDQPGVSVALWGARHPGELAPLDEVMGWRLDEEALAYVDEVIGETVHDPVGPEVMAPPEEAPARELVAPGMHREDGNGPPSTRARAAAVPRALHQPIRRSHRPGNRGAAALADPSCARRGAAQEPAVLHLRSRNRERSHA